LPLEFFLRVPMTSSKSLDLPQLLRHIKKVQTRKFPYIFEPILWAFPLLQIYGNDLRNACDQGCGAAAPEPRIFPGAGAQIKNQEPELKLKIRSRSNGYLRGSSGSGSISRYSGFTKLTYVCYL